MFECGVARPGPESGSRGSRAAEPGHQVPLTLLVSVGLCLSLSVTAFGHGGDSVARYQLPPACLAKNGRDTANEALSAIAQAIHRRSAKSPQTGLNDVAFACGIIARDLAAIDLARQELRSGKDLSAKAVARTVLTNALTEIGTLADLLNGPSI